MRLLFRMALFVAIIFGSQGAKAQTYCEYTFGFGWCDNTWAIDDITIGTFTELNSGCNAGVYSKQLTVSINVTKGAATPFTLGTGGQLVQWGIWVDLNADGDFTDATDYFWGSTTPSATVSGTMVIPASTVPGTTRIRIASRVQSVAITKADACDFGYQAETQDFKLVMNAAGGCLTPTNLNAIANATSASLSWDSAGTMYNVEYGSTGFTQGAGTIANTTTNAASITGLTPNTFYDFYVQTNCTTDSSSWNGPFTFKTNCTTISTFPYVENFDNAPWVANSGSNYSNSVISGCWDVLPVFNYNFTWLVRTGPTPSSNTGPSDAFGNTGSYVYAEAAGSPGDETYFTSPQFDISALAAPWLTFKYFMFGSEMGDLYTQVSADGGQNWTTIDSLKGEQQVSTIVSWLERGLDVSAYKSALFMFRLKAVQGPGYAKSDIAIDQVTLGDAPACKKASAVNLSNITGSTVQLDWINTAPTYYIEYGTQGFTQGTGNIDTVNTTGMHIINGLQGATYYDVYIRTDCSASGDGFSSWAGPYTFRTLVRPEWIEDFNTNGFAPNERWSEAKGLLANPTVFTSTYSSWAEDGWLNNGTSGAVRTTISTSSTLSYNWFFTELIDLGTGTNWELYFDAASTVSGSSGATTLQPDDTISVVISTDGGLTWNKSNTLFNITQATNLSNSGGTYTVDLSSYTGIIKLGFYAQSTMPNPTAVDIFIDNIGIREPAACPSPTAINAWNVGTYDLILGWTGTSAASTYTIEYGPVGFVQGTGTFITGITADSSLVTNLDPVTQYDFYVMSDCGVDSSLVAGPLTVLTGCPSVFATPYFTNFDVLTPGDPPASGKWDNCWESSSPIGYKYKFKSASGVPSWKTTGPIADHTTGVADQGTYMVADAGATGYDATLTNGPFDLSTLTAPTLNFWYYMYGADMGQLHVDVSTDMVNWQEDMFVISGEQQAASNEPWIQAKIALNQYLNDSIYLRFRTIKGSGSASDIAIDDISITNASGCISPSGLTAINKTTSSADLSWASYENQHTIEWGPLGFTQGTGSGTLVTGITSTIYSVTGISPNTGYDYYVKDTCTNLWIGPYTFFTSCTGPLAGAYTVGGTPGANNFATLEAALQSLENCGVSAPVTISLTGGNNGSNLSLGNIPGASITNFVTIKGSGTDTIYGAGVNFALELDNAAFVEFKNIYFDNYNGVQVIWLHNNTHHITIDSCTVKGRSIGSVMYNTANIVGSLLPDNSNGYGNNAHHITISNNTIEGGYTGISFFGNDPVHTTGYVITNNTISNVDTYGIRLDQTDSVFVDGNQMNGTNNQYSGYGLSLYDGNDFVLTNNYFVGKSAGITVTNGNISGVTQPSSIVNNMLIGLKNGDGLKLSGTSYVNLYFNSMYGASDGLTLQFYTNGDHLNFRNNIFAAKTGYAINNSSFPGSNYTLDNNLYYTEGSLFVLDNGTTYSDLAAWKIGNSAFNANSLEGNPYFASATDLHILGTLPNDAGVAIAGITTDFDGDIRPAAGATNVDIGADEFTSRINDIAVTQIVDPKSGCGDSTATVTVRIRNLGTSTATSVPIVVEVSGDLTATINYTYTGSLTNLASTDVSVGTLNTYAGGKNIVIKANTSLPADEDSSNDTLINTSTIFVPNKASFETPDTVCYDATATTVLSAAKYPGINYAWFSNLTDTVAYSTNDSITVPISGQPTWYLAYGEDVQDSLNTSNFLAQYGVSGGVMFNLTAKANIVIDSFEVNSRTNPGDTAELLMYYIPYSTFRGNETTPASWYAHDTVKYVSLGTSARSKVVLNKSFEIPLNGNYAIYLQFDAATTPAAPTGSFFSSPLMELEGGAGLYSIFDTPYNELFDGIIHAHSTSCSNARVAVDLNINSDTAIASFATIVSQPNKVDVDASASQGQLISWDFGDGTTATGTTATHNYTNGGKYTIVCTATDTVCNTTDTATFIAPMTIGIQENPLANSLNIFPNPSTGVFQISFDLATKSDVEISVFDATGRVIFADNLSNITSLEQYMLDVSDQPSGLYFVHISTDQNTSVSKITKM